LRFEPAQIDKLLSEADSGDRVFYTSMIIMPYYFIHGAMNLGAVYYHPSMKGSPIGKRWINRPDVRFAALYNPTVYHPSFRGLKENEWWTQSPEFRISPLNKRRVHGPINREGVIPVDPFKWIEIRTHGKSIPQHLRIWINNPGKTSSLVITPRGKARKSDKKGRIKKKIPEQWSGWMEFDLRSIQPSKKIRVYFYPAENEFSIAGISFENHRLNWPWAQKADLYFMFKDVNTGLVKISFNPQKLLPPPLNKKRISVIDDQGSSVLFRIHQ
jgi:hypothetical protein